MATIYLEVSMSDQCFEISPTLLRSTKVTSLFTHALGAKRGLPRIRAVCSRKGSRVLVSWSTMEYIGMSRTF
jgi:hypothetical protein